MSVLVEQLLYDCDFGLYLYGGLRKAGSYGMKRVLFFVSAFLYSDKVSHFFKRSYRRPIRLRRGRRLPSGSAGEELQDRHEGLFFFLQAVSPVPFHIAPAFILCVSYVGITSVRAFMGKKDAIVYPGGIKGVILGLCSACFRAAGN